VARAVVVDERPPLATLGASVRDGRARERR
jgi:hypothetical protein